MAAMCRGVQAFWGARVKRRGLPACRESRSHLAPGVGGRSRLQQHHAHRPGASSGSSVQWSVTVPVFRSDRRAVSQQPRCVSLVLPQRRAVEIGAPFLARRSNICVAALQDEVRHAAVASLQSCPRRRVAVVVVSVGVRRLQESFDGFGVAVRRCQVQSGAPVLLDTRWQAALKEEGEGAPRPPRRRPRPPPAAAPAPQTDQLRPRSAEACARPRASLPRTWCPRRALRPAPPSFLCRRRQGSVRLS